MKYVPPLKTALRPFEVACLMSAAWEKDLGRKPSEQTVLLTLAKSGLETAEWQSMWNFNFGNVKALGQYSGAYTCIKLNENLKRNGALKLVWFAPEGELASKDGPVVGQVFQVPTKETVGVFGHPQTRMRANESAEGGAARYVSALKANFPLSYQAAVSGVDAEKFVRTMRKEEYFTGNLDEYIRGTKWRCGLYSGVVSMALAGESPRPTIRRGSPERALVEWWQEHALGWGFPQKDGQFGPKTEEATKRWQAARGLGDDGVVGDSSWAVALREHAAKGKA